MSETGEPTPIAVLASGRGSNFEALLRSVQTGQVPARIVALVSDQAEAPVLAKARAAGIPALVVPGRPSEMSATDWKEQPIEQRRREHDRRVLEALAPHAPKWLIMAGYMRMVSPVLIGAFRSERGYVRIVNIHPSLLPAFPGVGSYGQAFRHGAQVAGVTVHLVEEEMDSGPICAQEAFSIRGMKSEEEVEKRGLEIEHRLFPETLKWLLKEQFRIEKREERLCVSES